VTIGKRDLASDQTRPQRSTISTKPTPGVWLRIALVANIAAQSAIIVTGAMVRLTGSGLGCPTWPECTPGSIVPQAGQVEGFHKFIEFGNRTLTGAVGLIALLAFVAVWRTHIGTRDDQWKSRGLALLPVIGTLIQAVLGGVTVLTGLNPFTVSAHFLVSILLVAITVLLYGRFFIEPQRPHRLVRLGINSVTLVGLIVVFTGTIVTGSGPHAGDEISARYALDVRVAAWLHADSVFLFVGLLIATLAASRVLAGSARSSVLTRNLWLILGIAAVQGIVGYTQWFTGLPWLLVGVHVVLAVLLWVALMFNWSRVLDNHVQTDDQRKASQISN
jgi:cytochrome c oxidase assembly protein subunit 15